MTENKWFYFYCWFIGGLSCAGGALYYFISGELYVNSNLRNALVAGQLILGVTIAVYGYKFYRQKAANK